MEALDALAQVGPRRFEQQVHVVIHQAVGEAEPALAPTDPGQQIEVDVPVEIVDVDVLPAVTPGEDVKDATGDLLP